MLPVCAAHGLGTRDTRVTAHRALPARGGSGDRGGGAGSVGCPVWGAWHGEPGTGCCSGWGCVGRSYWVPTTGCSVWGAQHRVLSLGWGCGVPGMGGCLVLGTQHGGAQHGVPSMGRLGGLVLGAQHGVPNIRCLVWGGVWYGCSMWGALFGLWVWGAQLRVPNMGCSFWGAQHEVLSLGCGCGVPGMGGLVLSAQRGVFSLGCSAWDATQGTQHGMRSSGYPTRGAQFGLGVWCAWYGVPRSGCPTWGAQCRVPHMGCQDRVPGRGSMVWGAQYGLWGVQYEGSSGGGAWHGVLSSRYPTWGARTGCPVQTGWFGVPGTGRLIWGAHYELPGLGSPVQGGQFEVPTMRFLLWDAL